MQGRRPHEELGPVQRSIDVLTAARRPAVVKCEEDAQGGHEPTVGIARAHSQVDGRLSGLPLTRHDSRKGLHVDVVRGAVDLEGMPVAGVGRVDQARIDLAELFVGESPGFQDVELEVRQEYVGLFDQLVEELLAFGFLQVDRHALLVAIDHEEVLVPVPHRQRLDAADAPGAVSRDGSLDVDYLGPEVGEVLSAHGPLEPLGQVEDPDSFQCLRHVLHSCSCAPGRVASAG